MKSLLRGGSLLIVTAIVSACAAHREEDKAATNPPADQRAVTAARESELHSSGAIVEVAVTATKSHAASHDFASPIAVASGVAIAPASPCCTPIYQQPANTERYQHLDDNPVHLVAEQPVSTFSIDVDTGAYANVRRFLNAGQLPPQDAVRVEEMINYFDYHYAPPANRETPFRVATELAPAPWNSQALLLRIGIKGFEIAAADRPPANLVFLIDVSGSMQTPEKLPLLKNAFRLLTDQLTARDRVSMVVYAGSSGVVLE
ncbi:MAG: VWA domain-containing protein, partial [Steroidobacter sp.]